MQENPHTAKSIPNIIVKIFILLANIKDVARHANVSVATVSRVINNKGYVNEHTKELVLKAIKDLNYVPNEIARSLYRKSSKIIGIIIPDLKNEFFNDMIAGIEIGRAHV